MKDISYEQLKLHMSLYKAGNITNCLGKWQDLTSDRTILDIVEYGLKLDFIDTPPLCKPYQYPVSQQEYIIINAEINKLLDKQVIIETNIEMGDFFSTIFTRPKKDGSNRMILNLKHLNEHIYSSHFKMDSIHTVLNMIKPGVWMASINLKDAYFSVPIHKEHQKYLKFMWTKPYMFTAMPNGYDPATRKFTKLLKPPFTKQGLWVIIQ